MDTSLLVQLGVPLLSAITTAIASVVGLAVRQSLGRVTDSIARLSAQVDSVGLKVDALERERVSHAVTQSRLATMETEVRESRARIDSLRLELDRRTLRGAVS